MKRKLFLLLTGALVVLWSQAGLAWCTVWSQDAIQVFDGNVILNQHTAGQRISNYQNSGGTNVRCDNDGGWFELSVTGARVPASVGNGVIKTDIDFVGVSITADVLNEDASGKTSTVITDGSFTTRRWVIPKVDDSSYATRTYRVVQNPVYQFWAIGPEDPKSGIFGAREIITLTTSGGGNYPTNDSTLIYGFTSKAAAIASCYMDASALYFAMPETKTTDFSQTGILEASKQQRTTSGGIDCDRDVNVQFTLSATDTVPGLPNVLEPEAGGAEGVGATFRYNFVSGETSELRDLTLGEPFNLLDGPVGQVRHTYFYLVAYYYRFGNEVSAGHFRSTAVLDVQIQ